MSRFTSTTSHFMICKTVSANGLGLLLLTFICLFSSCKEERPFQLDEEAKKVIGGNLATWMSKMPLAGKMELTGGNSGNFVITNAEQVFPFVGKFYNEDGIITGTDPKTKHIYSKQLALFQDPAFGEGFAYSALLYEAEELWLRNYYSEMGNVAFSGSNAINESYSASLQETKVFGKTREIKQSLFWVDANYRSLLSGFYQNGQLIFQFAFPCERENANVGLQKVREINEAMNLGLPAWETAEVEDLVVVPEGKGFWKNPYKVIFRDNFLALVECKIALLELDELNSRSADEYGFDEAFAGRETLEGCLLGFNLNKKGRDKASFEKAHASFPIADRKVGKNPVFLLPDSKGDRSVTKHAILHIKENIELQVSFTYPRHIADANQMWQEWMTTLKLYTL